MTCASAATTSISTMTAAPTAPSGRVRQNRVATVSQPSGAGAAAISGARSIGGFSAMAIGDDRERRAAKGGGGAPAAVAEARIHPGVGRVHEEDDEDEHAGDQH